MRHVPTFVLLLLLCMTSSSIAQLPRIISYQGVLTDGGGVAVGDGMYSITFKLYVEPSGGSEIWSEIQSVEVNKGIFSVNIGVMTPLDIPFETAHWLGITVEGGEELAPRVQLTVSPYCFNAWGVRGSTNLFPAEGRAGIGVMEPQATLHIASDETDGLRFDGVLPDAWARIIVNSGEGASSPSYEYFRGGAFLGRTYVDPSNTWNLQLGGFDRIRASGANGYIGIGMVDPLEKLEVDGAVRLGTTSSTNTGTIRWTGSDFEGYDGSVWKSFTSGGGGSLPPGTSGQTLRHNGSDWTASSVLYNDGTNIGIGTTNPQQKLHVNGYGQFDMPDCQLNISTPGGWPGFIAYESIGGKRRDVTFDDSRIRLAASMTSSAPGPHDGLAITEGGNVGIGQSNPLEKLHIHGDGPTYVLLNAPSGYSPGVMFSVSESIMWRLLYHPVEGTLQFYREGVGPKMVIGNGGRVGIGTTNLHATGELEVHNPNMKSGAAIIGYSYWDTPPSLGGAIAVAGIHTDDGVGGTGVYGEATGWNASIDPQVGVYGFADDGYGVYSDGTLGSSGPLVTLAATRDFGHRQLYAVQSAGNWFEDFGEGRLENGEANIEIDPVFAQTVTLGDAYHVFLTPLGDCGLYVSEKTARYFVVRARDGKTDDIAFDYRIVAKRSGFESKRLESAESPQAMRQRLNVPRRNDLRR
ncbi:MAG TPA: hypothetical protein VLA34_10690 [Candidatus Krumholzibacterium sp.]|nr:hypothetical protein [Candidatus Krumholzibacterium sp.]